MRRLRLTPVNLLILAGLGLALGVRLWGIGFGSHVPLARPDEESFLFGGFNYFGSKDPAYTLNTGWPLGFFRLSYLIEVIERLVYRAPAGGPASLGCIFALRPSAIYLGIRLVSALADVATALVVGLTARRLARRNEAELAFAFGVFAYAVNYLAAREAHNAMVNSTLALCIALVTLASVWAIQDSPWWLVVAGALSGAGFGLKYSAAPLFFVCLAGGVGALMRFRPRGRTWAIGGVTVVAAALAFWIVSPEAIANPGPFWKGFTSVLGRYGPAFGGMLDLSFPHEPGWKFHLLTNLPVAFGWAGYLLGIAGLVIAARERRLESSPVLAQTLASLAMLVPLAQLFVRYALPIIPPLAVGLGIALARLSSVASQRFSGARAAAALGAVAVLALGPPLVRLVEFDHLMAEPDTRELAQRWVIEHGGTGASFGYYQQVHFVEPSWKEACVGKVPSWIDPAAAAETPNHGPPFWNELVKQDPLSLLQMGLDGSFKGQDINGADYVLWPSPVLMCGKQGRLEAPEPSGQCFALADVISPGTPACGDLFDMFDSFFLPYTAFDGVLRPGPRVGIYKNLCKR